MIMLGTKSPRLGWASALGTLSLSAVLLPLTPSWAQKPAQEPQATVFAYQVAEEPQTTVFEYVVKGDDLAQATDKAKAEKVRVFVDTDDDIEQVQADSLDKAIELIKQRIDALAKQAGGSDKQAAQVKGLEKAVAELQLAKTKISSSEAPKDPTKQEVRKRIVRRLETLAQSPLTAEKKAQIDKARSRVEVLRKELEEKRKQLTDAQAELQKLVASRAKYRVVEALPRQTIVARPLELRATVEASSARLDQPKTSTSLSPSDKDRIELLERKLAKILDEVASLKKHDEKPK